MKRPIASLATLLVLFSGVLPLHAFADPVCPEVSTTFPKAVVCVSATQGFQRVMVTPARLPPTRLRASFDGESSADWPGAAGKHAELEWDPAQSNRLAQSVHLGPGLWRVTFSADPLPLAASDPQRPPVYLSVGVTFDKQHNASELVAKATFHYLAETVTKGASGALDTRSLAVNDISDRGGAYAPFTVTVQVTDLPKLADATEGLSTSEGGAIGGRSIDDTGSQMVNELFAVLAEVAYEQASARAFRALTDRLVALSCTELRLNAALPGLDGVAGLLLVPPRDGTPWQEESQENLLLPNTCAIIRGLRLEDLTAAGGNLLEALQRDILWLSANALLPQLTLPVKDAARQVERRYARHLLTQLVLTLSTQLVNSRSFDIRQTQLLLLDATRHGWKDTDATAYTCGVQLAFAAMAQCHASSRCDARQVVDLVLRPENYFNLEGSGCKEFLAGSKVEELRAVWPDLEQFVERGLKVLQPTSRSDPREHLRLAVDLGMDLLDRTAVPSKDQQLITVLKDIRLIFQGAVDQDVQPVLVAAGRIVRRKQLELCYRQGPGGPVAQRLCDGKLTGNFTRASYLMAAVASYARTYASGSKADPRQLEAAREARRSAVRSLIQAATDRTQRDGDRLVSLGTAVGFTTGWQRLEFRDNEVLLPQLSLPLGVAFQGLPDSRLTGAGRWFGWHAQFSFADLGQYITYRKNGTVTPARWDTALMLGLQGGVLIGNSRDTFLIGPDIRYSPTLFVEPGSESGGGALRVGLTAAYYVSFFDFN